MTKFLIAVAVIVLGGISAHAQVIKLTEQVGDFSGNVYDLCISTSGKTLLVPESGQISLYNTDTRALIKRWTNGHSKPILSMALSSDTTLLASGGLDSLVVLWDASSGSVNRKLHLHEGIITSVHMNRDRSLVASGSSDKKVVIFDLVNDTIAYTLTDFTSDITCVKFSPDGQLLAVASLDKEIKLYDAAHGQLLAQLEGHKSRVRDLSFNPNSSMLYSCGDDSRVIVWNIRKKGNIIIEKTKKYGSEWLLSVDADNNFQASAVAGLDLKVYVTTNFGTTVGKIGIPVNRIKFLPSIGGMLKLAVATRGKGVYIIDTMQFESQKQ